MTFEKYQETRSFFFRESNPKKIIELDQSRIQVDEFWKNESFYAK